MRTGPVSLSYRQLEEAATALSRRLRRSHVGKGSLVIVAMDTGAQLTATFLGVLDAGAAYVPIDPALPRDRLRWHCADSGATHVITESRYADHFVGCGLTVSVVDDTPASAGSDTPGDREPASPDLADDDLAYAIYTSGSTGVPKAVLIEHGALAQYIHAAAEKFQLSTGDAVLQFNSPTFDAAAEEIYSTLACGARLVVHEREWPPSAAALDAICRRHGVTVLDLPTAYFHYWVKALELDRRPLPSTLRLVIIGGERLDRSRWLSWSRVCGTRSIQLLNTYGPTETTIVATWVWLTPDLLSEGNEVPIGTAVPGVTTLVVDEGGLPLPIGAVGELVISGRCVARGYLGRPALTGERFPTNPRGGGRIFRTRDPGRWRRATGVCRSH